MIVVVLSLAPTVNFRSDFVGANAAAGFFEFGHLSQIIIEKWQLFEDIVPCQHWLKQRMDELEDPVTLLRTTARFCRANTSASTCTLQIGIVLWAFDVITTEKAERRSTREPKSGCECARRATLKPPRWMFGG
jgi:hypothetical protein